MAATNNSNLRLLFAERIIELYNLQFIKNHIISETEAYNFGSFLVYKSNKLHLIILKIVVVFALIYCVINFFLNNIEDALILIGLLINAIVCIFLYNKGFIVASKLLNLAVVNLAITFATFYDGKESFGLGFFIPIILGTLIVFQGNQRKIGMVSATISFIWFMFLSMSDFHIGYRPPLTPTQLHTEWVFNLFGSASIAILEVFYVLRLSNQIQESLVNQTRALDKINKELSQIILTRDKITSTISHDVRGPVATVSAGLNALHIHEHYSADDKMIIHELRKSSEATVDLIDNLMFWSGSQTHQIIYKPELIRLAEIKRMVIDFKSLHVLKEIEVVLHIPETEFVRADRVLLQCILRNLFSNAVKFTPTGGRITIAAQPSKQGIKISIRDTGVGMDKTAQERILTGDSFTTRGTSREQGYGIGMQLVREFIQLHGSILHIESEVGVGSVFYFTLDR